TPYEPPRVPVPFFASMAALTELDVPSFVRSWPNVAPSRLALTDVPRVCVCSPVSSLNVFDDVREVTSEPSLPMVVLRPFVEVWPSASVWSVRDGPSSSLPSAAEMRLVRSCDSTTLPPRSGSLTTVELVRSAPSLALPPLYEALQPLDWLDEPWSSFWAWLF